MKSKQTKKQRKVSQESVCNITQQFQLWARGSVPPHYCCRRHTTQMVRWEGRENQPKGPQNKMFWLQALDNNPASVVVQGIGVGGTARSERRWKIGWLLLLKNNCSAGPVFFELFLGITQIINMKKLVDGQGIIFLKQLKNWFFFFLDV